MSQMNVLNSSDCWLGFSLIVIKKKKSLFAEHKMCVVVYFDWQIKLCTHYSSAHIPFHNIPDFNHKGWLIRHRNKMIPSKSPPGVTVWPHWPHTQNQLRLNCHTQTQVEQIEKNLHPSIDAGIEGRRRLQPCSERCVHASQGPRLPNARL